jgi:methyl-CpG-binding domain protein 4
MKRQRMAVLPDGLMIQEIFRDDPWKLLVGCMMLNQTTGTQVHQVIHKFFKKYPNPVKAMNARTETMEEIIKPLGLFRRRTQSIKKFSHDYLNKNWKRPSECFGIGKYAEDSWDIFVANNLDVKPEDKELIAYLKRMEK